jgi:hypothetical protein
MIARGNGAAGKWDSASEAEWIAIAAQHRTRMVGQEVDDGARGSARANSFAPTVSNRRLASPG